MGRAWLSVSFAALALAGCQFMGLRPTTTGSIAAYASPTTVADPTAGALLASQMARGLNDDDRRVAEAAEYRAFDVARPGVPMAWRGRSAHGEIVVGTPYRINDYDCRDYTHVITGGDGQVETARGAACRRPNGGWQPIG